MKKNFLLLVLVFSIFFVGCTKKVEKISISGDVDTGVIVTGNVLTGSNITGDLDTGNTTTGNIIISDTGFKFSYMNKEWNIVFYKSGIYYKSGNYLERIIYSDTGFKFLSNLTGKIILFTDFSGTLKLYKSGDLYFVTGTMTNFDLETFEDLGGGYWKDKNGVYLNGIKMNKYDPSTFKIDMVNKQVSAPKYSPKPYTNPTGRGTKSKSNSSKNYGYGYDENVGSPAPAPAPYTNPTGRGTTQKSNNTTNNSYGYGNTQVK